MIIKVLGKDYDFSINNQFIDVLVPNSGSASTMEGEMLRAINRIIYRFWNDGDRYHIGYGCETAGPAMSFLMTHTLLPISIRHFAEDINVGIESLNDSEYFDKIFELLEFILNYIESKKYRYIDISPSVDMLNTKSLWEDEEDEEEDDWCDYDEEDDW